MVPSTDPAPLTEPTATDQRRSRKFSWTEVDPSLIRKLLQAAYEKFGPAAEATRLASMSERQLLREAERVLGRPPKRKLRRALSDTLRREWLPKAAPDVLVTLTGTTNRYDPLTTHRARLEWLHSRNLTERFTDNLWREFVAAHKVKTGHDQSGPVATQTSIRSVVDLLGQDEVDSRTPYDHQRAAWLELDRLRSSRGRRSGLMVIPTGGGKTSTMVSWIITEMKRRPKLKVLWIADQQELVDQAAHEFIKTARTASPGFRKRLRAVHGRAGRPSALAAGDSDVVCATRQSLIGKNFDRKTKDTIKAFLDGPTIVVIDEAHHAVSPTYQQLIDFIWSVGRGIMLVGLTATPWPAGAGQTAVLRQTFARELVSVTTAELIAKGDLARPVLHSLRTEERVDVTTEDLRALGYNREIPSRIARQLDREARNQLVVRQWIKHQEVWGKTLVFACDTRHADSLGESFSDAGVRVDVVHSAADVDRAAVLAEFRKATDARVLVSVGMLLEGVDIPSARTAFLCRPTTSHIVMRQMIGRVLRGVRAKGDPEAHIVEFVDQWQEDGHALNSVSILSPVDMPDVPVQPTSEGEGAEEHQLPPLMADDGVTELGADLIRSITRQIRERVQDGHTATLTSSRLVGFYDLDVRRLPVFEHTQDAWADLGRWALDPRDKRGTPATTLFDDVPPPSPRAEEIKAFVDYCRSYTNLPAFLPVEASVDVVATARRLIDAGPLTVKDRIEMLRSEHESPLAKSLYPSLQHWIEAVEQETLVQLQVIPSGARPESVPTPEGTPTKKLMRSRNPRDLHALMKEVATDGENLLAGESTYDGWLHPAELPSIGWTRNPVQSSWAHWSWRKSSRAKDRPVIRINVALNAPKSQIPDELLKYLIWHELCHHLTPGQGHGAEFRRLESMWPDHARLDHQLDTLHEVYAMPTRPSR